MTALIVIQPTRGLLFEKSFLPPGWNGHRLPGGLLLILYADSAMALTIALSLWIAACVGIGNLLYGLRSYAFLMAACTCAVVALSGHQNPSTFTASLSEGSPASLSDCRGNGSDRALPPRQSRDELENRLRRVAADSVARLALLLRQDGGETWFAGSRIS